MSARHQDPRSRLAVALDLPDRAAILAMARLLKEDAGVLKIGLEAFVSEGPALVVELVSSNADIFLDLKLHDIPNTVGRAARAAAKTGASIVNCHASGGVEMMKAFADGARSAAPPGRPAPRLVAVTILTSLDAAALQAIGVSGSPHEAALRLAVQARESGLDGVVCSPEEISAIRSETGKDFFLVVPGVRPRGVEAGDQKRVATPVDAIRAGADLLVVGRPITAAKDPAGAAREIVLEIASGL